MQLKTMRNIRSTLALATCAVLHGKANALEPADDWKVESAVLYYSEQDRVDVWEPAILGTRTLSEDESVTLRGVVDTMSGATPNGAVPSRKAETYTSSSGNAYTVPAGAFQTKSFDDTRGALGVDWTKNVDRLIKRTLSGDVSLETDYFSLGGGLTYAVDNENRMTTVTGGLGFSFDLVSPSGGAPPELGLVSASVPSGGGGDDDEDGEGGGDDSVFSGEKKYTASALLGVTQILSRRALTQLNYTYNYSSGYLNDPYKLLSLVDANGETVDHVFEKRPDRRNGNALYWAFVYHLPKDVVHLSYRYYWDDWGIRSHTFDIKYRFELGESGYLQPEVRYYTQSAADFYHLFLLSGSPLPGDASADYRLADMHSTVAGLKYGLPVGKDGEFSIRAAYMQQTGDNHPNEAIGILRQYDLYPGLDATIIQVGFTARF